jgi:MFS family permease
VDRFGPRFPLTLGPAAAGFGCFLFTLPELTNGAAGFWKNYLPALLLLGLGMGITVAPLSTTVMGSVPSNRIGLASGINSTLSRLSAVLAIAILAPMALMAFDRSLQSRTLHLNLPPVARTVLAAEAAKLGEAKAPAALIETTRQAVDHQIKLAFVDVFRLVAGIAAVLSWLSALAAMLLIERRRSNAS